MFAEEPHVPNSTKPKNQFFHSTSMNIYYSSQINYALCIFYIQLWKVEYSFMGGTWIEQSPVKLNLIWHTNTILSKIEYAWIVTKWTKSELMPLPIVFHAWLKKKLCFWSIFYNSKAYFQTIQILFIFDKILIIFFFQQKKIITCFNMETLEKNEKKEGWFCKTSPRTTQSSNLIY